MKEGKIVKVSGPLVVAEGLKDAKMYDMVKVGTHKLMGEIIELRGDLASIQVYEETAGLGPEDPVYPQNEPLSVELGPGLLTSIYDGVQRPLDILREKAGNYVTRGVDAPALDREKKWDFKPRVKVGDKVGPGDIIGEVQETSVVEHRIMVPPNIEGEVKKIEAGKYTVEDTVATVKTPQGEKEIKMLTRWPVRKERPYKKRISPFAPLVTGQRVIDTFFPIAKGGTACAPGPFGSGKCVSGDTPVMLGDRKVIPIKEIYESYKDKGKRVQGTDEEYTLLDKPLEVFSYLDGQLTRNLATTVYKGKTSRTVKIRTRTGRIAEVTPIHKLLKIDKDMTIAETEACSLKVGDFLVTPRVVSASTDVQRIPVDELFGNCRVVDEPVLEEVSVLIGRLAERFGTKKEVARKLGVSYEVLIEYFLRRNRPTLSFVSKVYSLSGRRLPEITYVKGERQSKKTKIPRWFDKKMAAFLGLALGDGSLKVNTIRFYNNDEEMLNLFEKLAEELFGLSAKRSVANTVKCSQINSAIIVKLLKCFGYPEYKKSRTCFVPSLLHNSPGVVIGAFLGTYFACDGHFNAKKGEIEYSTASEAMQSGLSYLLLRLGLVTRLSNKGKEGSRHYRLCISSRAQVQRFFEQCAVEAPKFRRLHRYLSEPRGGFTSIDVVPLGSEYLREIYKAAARPYQRLKESGVEIHNYLAGELLSRDMFRKLAETLDEPSLVKFASNHLEHIYCDKIVEIKEINQVSDVYDLEVPKGNNFVGGHAPMIFHNTVIQHQLAKWADAEIIVFVGCGERGNEMTDVLLEFPRLIDPHTGESLMKRTVLVANTSNMPVAAREASIYTGITIAEYFRDMGYNVALQADSTSRWAEALREISGRLEEMPGEEGFPAYLGSRLAAFYERAGRVVCLSSDSREGTVTAIGSVSPPGGDLSEPVVQATLRVVKVFWSLEDKLAYERHYPAVNWLTSYSLYLDKMEGFWTEEIDPEFKKLHGKAMELLQKEAELAEIVRLVGIDALSPRERLILETAKSIREDFLQQSAFHEVDTYTSMKKQHLILKAILLFHELSLEATAAEVPLEDILAIKARETIARAKYVKEDELDKLNKLEKEISSQFKILIRKEAKE